MTAIETVMVRSCFSVSAITIGAAAFAVEIFADAGGDFVGDPRTQGLADVDVFAGDLDLHKSINAPGVGRCQPAVITEITCSAPRAINPAASTRMLAESAARP